MITRETIKINWNDPKSIRQAETKKARLENKGFSFIKRIVSKWNEDFLIYEKEIILK